MQNDTPFEGCAGLREKWVQAFQARPVDFEAFGVLFGRSNYLVAAEDAGRVTICVEDDGGGLAAAEPGGMTLGQVGLAGMEERVRALKGEFAVEEIADGVRIRAALPRRREKQSA